MHTGHSRPSTTVRWWCGSGTLYFVDRQSEIHDSLRFPLSSYLYIPYSIQYHRANRYNNTCGNGTLPCNVRRSFCIITRPATRKISAIFRVIRGLGGHSLTCRMLGVGTLAGGICDFQKVTIYCDVYTRRELFPWPRFGLRTKTERWFMYRCGAYTRVTCGVVNVYYSINICVYINI